MSIAARHHPRLIGRLLALLGLVFAIPLITLCALAIKCSSRGPILFRARRMGQSQQPFTMYKLRSMHLYPGVGEVPITAGRDARVFPVGRLLRRFKLDELPQLINVVRGEMALVGPRPEDPSIVAQHYTQAMLQTLQVPPGLTSPGSLAYYAQESRLPDEPVHAHRTYVTELLPRKIALDLVYVGKRSLKYDLELLMRTVAAICGLRQLFLNTEASERVESARVLEAGTIMPSHKRAADR